MTFEEFLRSQDGLNCMALPITDPKYLQNRLWWAYQAGLVEGMTDKRPVARDAPTS